MRKDYIDSCVFLEHILDKNQNCKDYINTLGYKNRNLGIISHFVISEVFIAILTKILSKDKNQEKVEKEIALIYFKNIIEELRKNNNLIINKIDNSIIDEELYKELKNINYSLSDDDILHLINAIKQCCNYFITIDKEIINNKILRDYLQNKHEIKVIEL